MPKSVFVFWLSAFLFLIAIYIMHRLKYCTRILTLSYVSVCLTLIKISSTGYSFSHRFIPSSPTTYIFNNFYQLEHLPHSFSCPLNSSFLYFHFTTNAFCFLFTSNSLLLPVTPCIKYCLHFFNVSFNLNYIFYQYLFSI